jgi:tripartite-type tricarboxylate transporter receptor subunit TctC
MKASLRFAALFLALALWSAAHAQDRWPTKPIRMVVPFTPGAASDVLGRIVGQRLSEVWGQQIVIDNRPGAGGMLGIALVAKSPPDGHTLLFPGTVFVTNAALQPSLPYDPLRDFAGVTQLGFSATMLVAAPALGVKSVKDLVALAQAQPGKLIYGSGGAGGATHLHGERFRVATGIKVVHVGFKGIPEALVQILGGRVHYAFSGFANTLPFVRDGRLLALAVLLPQRSPLLPDVPAMKEALPAYERHESYALIAPARTPPAILNRISKDVARVLALPDVGEKLQAMGFVAAPTTPREHDEILRAQIEGLARLAREAGLKPN